MIMAIKENLETFAVKTALKYLNKDPENNIPKLLDMFEILDVKNEFAPIYDAIRPVINDKNSNWYKLILSLWQDIDPGVRNRLFENFVIKGSIAGYKKQEENKARYKCKIP